MAATTTSPESVEAPARRRASASGARLSDVCRSEWTKLRSVRSTYWTFVVTIVLVVGIGAIAAAAVSSHVRKHPGDIPDDPMVVTFLGLQFAQLSIGVLGVLVMSAEYSTGMIRSTFAAVPRRMRVLGAKTLVFGVVTLAIGLVACWATFEIGTSLEHGMVPGYSYGLGTHLGPNGPVAGRAVIGAALYLVVAGLMGVALGTLVRRTAGAIVVLVALLYVLPGVVGSLRDSVGVFKTIFKFLPLTAGEQAFRLTHPSGYLQSPWGGLLVFAAWVAVLFGVAVLALQRRDV